MNDVGSVALIFWGTLQRRRVSLFWFSLAAGAFHWLVAVSFPAIGGTEAVTSVISTFPEGLRSLLKLAPNLQAGFGTQDYLAFTWLHPLFIGLGAAFVVSRARDGLTGEIESGSVYLILSRPIRRWTFVTGKSLEMITGAAAIALSGWIGLAIGVQTLPYELPMTGYLWAALAAWLVFSALGGGAFFIASFCSRTAVASAIGAAWTILAFVLDVIPAVSTSPIAWINPWHHYFPQEIVAIGHVDLWGMTVLVLWTLFGIGGAIVVFGHRDLV